jgi:hypothetical protein
MVGGFVPLCFQRFEPAPGFFQGETQGAERRLDVLRSADQGLPEVAVLRDVPFEDSHPVRGLDEEPGLFAELGRELVLLPAEELDLLVGPDAFVLGLRQALQRLQVFAAQALDALLLDEPGFARNLEVRLGADDVGTVRPEHFFETAEPRLEVFKLLGQGKDVFEELVAVAFGALFLLLEKLDPFRFALDVALDPGDVGLQAEKLFLALLEALLQVPELLPPRRRVFLLAPQAGRDVPFAEETVLVKGGGFALGILEQDEFSLVVVGGQLPDALAQAPVAVGGLGLALEGVFAFSTSMMMSSRRMRFCPVLSSFDWAWRLLSL